MAFKKTYKILSKGNILPGFDKEQVIDNIHSITQIHKEIIIRKFFSGKTVVIRHAYTQEDASQLQKKFSRTGIETYIHEFSEPGITQSTESGSKPETETNVTKEKGFNHSTKPKKPGNNTQTNKRTNRPDWYALEEIKSLIKVTSDSELLMLFQFNKKYCLYGIFHIKKQLFKKICNNAKSNFYKYLQNLKQSIFSSPSYQKQTS